MGLARRIPDWLRVTWAVAWAPLWLFLLHPYWRRQGRRSPARWVLGGHRGRLYADNAAGVERAAREAGRDVTWIANPGAAPAVQAQGARVLHRHSWAARRAISRASVLVYSHGEDDLDVLMLLLRGRTAPRVYLNHCLNLLKAGGVLSPGWESQPRWLRALRTWLITDCDRLLAASAKEAENFAASYPMHAEKLRRGGGAHLDAWVPGASSAPERRIFWFPTFRESAEDREHLAQSVREVCSSPRLKRWLLEHGMELWVGVHINSGGSAPLSLEPPFVAAPLTDVARDISRSALLISDYSGVVFDFLLTERPQILFAFDLESYLRSRVLFEDYDALDFALHPRTPEALIDALCSEAWRSEALRAGAERARRRYLPTRERGFAAASVEAIDREIELFAPPAEATPSRRPAATISEHPAPQRR